MEQINFPGGIFWKQDPFYSAGLGSIHGPSGRRYFGLVNRTDAATFASDLRVACVEILGAMREHSAEKCRYIAVDPNTPPSSYENGFNDAAKKFAKDIRAVDLSAILDGEQAEGSSQ